MAFNFLKSSYEKIKSALAKTRSLLGDKLKKLFAGKVDEEALEKLEQILYEADLGVQLSSALTEKMREFLRKNPEAKSGQLLEQLEKEILALLPPTKEAYATEKEGPHVILIVGVNGNGKTTTAAKLAKHYLENKKKPLFAAADTFRAAATEQLELWAERLQIEIVKGRMGSDPAAVAFDAVNAAKARDADVLLIDTAGRLHTKTSLMQELEKIRRSCQKALPGSPHETLLVLDATTGQNALDQAKIFMQYTPISALILTKLDGTAKGGMAIAIQHQLKIPVEFIGVGEGMDDLLPFDPQTFVKSLIE